MTTKALHQTAPRRSLTDRLSALTRRWALNARIRRDTRRLEEMNDDQLRDIGLHRGDIRHAVRWGTRP